MDTRLRKIWKDLAERKARSFTTLVGLVVGLWGMGAVTVAWVVLSHDLAENYARTNPPNLVIDAGPGTLPALGGLAGLEAWDNRPLLISRIEASPDFYLPLHLYVVEDFDRLPVARFFPGEGAFPPPEGELLIERSGGILLQIMRAQAKSPEPGRERHSGPVVVDDEQPDRIGIQLPGGAVVRARIAGEVFDPGLAPSTQEQIIYGYVTRETAESWLPGALPIRLITRTAAGREKEIAGRLEGYFFEAGIPEASAEFPDPARHPHQFQMDTILYLLAGLGLLAFAMGVVLVVNLVNGILTNQIRQIGTLKAMGASTAGVTALYLGSQLLLGLASCVIALPLAVKSGYWLCRVIAAMLNFDILTTQIPIAVYAALIAAGGLLPMLAAWLPVRRWSGLAVRDALDNYGAGGGYHQGSRLDRLHLPLPVTVRAGLRNALRRPVRFALGVATIGIGAAVFMIAMNMRSSIVNTADVEEATVVYDLSIRFARDAPWSGVSWMSRFDAVDRVEFWPATRATVVAMDEIGAEEITVVGTPADTWAVKPNLVSGQWISDHKPDGAVVTHRLMKRLPGLRLGDRLLLRFGDKRVEVEIAGVDKRFGQAMLRLPLTGYLELTGADPELGRIALLDLDPETASRTGEFIPLLESHFPGTGLEIGQIAASRLAARVIRNHLDVIVVMLVFVAAVMLFISGLGMASGTSTSVIERTRELGVLRAIGATPLAILRMLTVEGLAVAMTGCALAMLIADPLSRRLEAFIGNGIVEYPFDHRFSLEGLALCIGIVALLNLLATLGPARLAARGAVARAVGYE
jgi:hypothetical protein